MGTRPFILVIEDDEALGYVYGRILDSQGYDVVVARNYWCAEPTINGGRPIDVAVVDVYLEPAPHGLSVARMTQMRHPRAEVVFVSDHELPEQVSGYAALRKPVADGALLAAVRSALKENEVPAHASIGS